jgi:hypothetical protein
MSENPNSLRFAALDGVTTLYKFKAYATQQDKMRIREILVDHKIYFSRPSQLNDDRDLRPNLKFRGTSEAETRALILHDAEAAWPRRQPAYSPEELTWLRHRLTHSSIEGLERDALQRTHERLEREYWIFSLAASRDYISMWRDYGDHDRGICIHFRSDGDSPFGAAQRVLYQADIPLLFVPLGDEQEVADRSTLTKTLKWSGEREYRLIRYPDVDLSEAHLHFDGQRAQFPAWAITGITVGMKMPPTEVREILEIAESHEPPIPVWRPNGDVID